MAKARTIQIFLPDGNPRGVKIAEITNRTIEVILIPRASVKYAISSAELNNVGVYFLVGESEDGGKPIVYIGESEDCAERLCSHNQMKDFWQYGLVVVSKTEIFTKAHVRYLEWHCIEQAEQAGRYTLENTNSRKKTHISKPVVADLLDNFEDIKILVSTLGYKIFDKIQHPIDEDLLYCKGKETDGKGEYTEDGFIVFKGSKCRLTPVSSYSEQLIAHRKRLISEETITEKDGHYVFTCDRVFGSPSTAAEILLGSSANGWDAWKYKNGKTLDEVKRQS